MLLYIDILALIILLIIIIYEVIISIITYPWQKPEMPLVVSLNQHADTFKVPFKPLWWATGRYTQTVLYESLGRTNKKPLRREYCNLKDGTEIALDIIDNSKMDLNTPILFICHGLYGCADNGNIHEVSHSLPNYRVVVYNRRGHNGPKLNGKFPKHVDIEDMTDVLDYVKNKYSEATITGFGYSAGANLIAQYAGMVKTHPFDKVISIANGHHLYELTETVDWVVDRFLVYKMRTFALEHIDDIKVDYNKLLNCSTVREIEQLTGANLNNYKTVKDYYNDCSSYKWLEHINVPFLSISAEDDPLIQAPINYYATKAALKNKNIIAIVTKKGGHVAWIDRFGHSWAIDRIVDFINLKY